MTGLLLPKYLGMSYEKNENEQLHLCHEKFKRDFGVICQKV